MYIKGTVKIFVKGKNENLDYAIYLYSTYVRSSFGIWSTVKYLGPFLRISSTLSLKRRSRDRNRQFLNFFGFFLG